MTVESLRASLADRYKIERELGQGGMATVYLAEDLKHGRRVAIKVLRPELAAVIGAERFVREIRTIAALQHPHILGLIDSGEAGGTAYYVMPFVEGESLRDRLNREKQLPVAEAVRIATEAASALDYAHRHGVIHRDIKPENILLHDGQALVADFGIALAVTQAGGTRMTETGMSLGTPHYMSPEQAMGEREITARSDIYALGCVTYEMLLGEPPFVGPTAQAVVARVMTEEPRPLTIQRRTIPASVEDAVLTALSKLPADRFASAAEFTAALSGQASPTRTSTAAPHRTAQPRSRRAALLYAALATVSVLAAWGWLRPGKTVSSTEVRRVDLMMPDSSPLEFIGEATVGVGQNALALSRDGRILVYVGGGKGRPLLYVRPLDRFDATPLAGTEGAYAPFFSPDGAWIGFFADNQLKKVPVGGGPVNTLADAALSTGGAWSSQGSIVFLSNSGNQLLKVSANGGRAVALPIPSTGYLKTLSFLPGDQELLCSAYSDQGFYYLLVHSASGGEDRVLVRSGPAQPWHPGILLPEETLIGTMPRYANGQLLYTHADGRLLSIGFDPKTLSTSGEPVVVATGVRRESYSGHTQVALAQNGTLAYVAGSGADIGVLAWMDRRGRLDTLPFPPANSLGTDVSPDGSAVAVAIPSVSGNLELWRYDLRSGDRQRVLSGLASGETRWTPDGRHLIAGLVSGVLVMLDPARPGRLDTLVQGNMRPASVSPDGRFLLGSYAVNDSGVNLPFLAQLDGKSAAQTLGYGGRSGAFLPYFSPDGHWVAYLGGSGGVFVEPYPGTGEVSRISGQLEGDVPYWSKRGDEIFFPSASQMYVVGVHPGSPPRFDEPRLMAPQRFANFAGRPYAVAPDGQRFLIKVPASEHSARSIRLELRGGR
jgi:serine/threonine-protein kinase